MSLLLLSAVRIVNAVSQGECSSRPLLITAAAIYRVIIKSLLAGVCFPVIVYHVQV